MGTASAGVYVRKQLPGVRERTVGAAGVCPRFALVLG